MSLSPASRSLGRVGRGAWRLWRFWTLVLTLPPTWLHESVHAAVATPFAEQVAIVYDGASDQVSCQVLFDEEAMPGYWVQKAIALAPHVSGLVIGAAVIWQWARSGFVLEGSLDLLFWSVLLAWWVVFTAGEALPARVAPGGDGGD